MELNAQSQQALQQIKRKTEAQLVAYTRKDYVCSVRNGKHLYFNHPKPVEYIPSPNIPDFIAKHRKLAKSIAIKKVLERKKIGKVILQSFNYINFKIEDKAVCISNFKACKI